MLWVSAKRIQKKLDAMEPEALYNLLLAFRDSYFSREEYGYLKARDRGQFDEWKKECIEKTLNWCARSSDQRNELLVRLGLPTGDQVRSRRFAVLVFVGVLAIFVPIGITWYTTNHEVDTPGDSTNAFLCEVCRAQATIQVDHGDRVGTYCAEHGDAAREQAGFPDWDEMLPPESVPILASQPSE